MKLIRHLISSFINFLFPKSSHILELESTASTDVISILKLHQEKSVPPLANITSLFPYRDNTVHDVIHEIKYAANKTLASKIAPALIQVCPRDSLITFIPATQSRKEKRGFDQGTLILEAMKEHAPHYIYERNLLTWNRKVTQQSLTENKEERLKNMSNALICKNPELVKNKTIVVIDDVCTTGATLYEAQRALEDSGAAHIVLLTLAH
jgi:competence protein ComFC